MVASIVRLEGEQKVNTHTTSEQFSPSVTALADGGWVVTWSTESYTGSVWGIYQQRYNANGTLSNSEQRVNTYSYPPEREPSITALADGGWVVTWQSNGQDGSGFSVY